MTSTQLSAGRYYIGDLCYIKTVDWDDLLAKSQFDDGHFTLSDGRDFVIMSTQWGDGTYYDDQNRQYGVDSGTIGIIGVSDDHASVPGGQLVDFDEDFEVWSHSGRLHFGELVINTG